VAAPQLRELHHQGSRYLKAYLETISRLQETLIPLILRPLQPNLVAAIVISVFSAHHGEFVLPATKARQLISLQSAQNSAGIQTLLDVRSAPAQGFIVY
jgi:hypothetical protein